MRSRDELELGEPLRSGVLAIDAGYEHSGREAVLGRQRLAVQPDDDVPLRHLLVGLFAEDGGIFHEPDQSTGTEDGDRALATRGVFVEPLARLLRDGALDGTLVRLPDIDQTATVLFNQVGWTYLALRVGQRWSREHAEDAVVTLAMASVAARRLDRGRDNR